MAKVRKTKTALKSQRDALNRFERYLPTLELKKQQLRIEVNRIAAELATRREAIEALRAEMETWVALFSEEWKLDSILALGRVVERRDNIAGVPVSVLESIEFVRAPIDLFETPPWVDDALDALEKRIRLDVEIQSLQRAADLLAEELRITSQRVNLFDKVKIPESRENIRVIRIALGDVQASAVARAKAAKQRIVSEGATLG